MSDRCSCVDGPNYRCGAGRPCDVHGDVDALMAWGKYVVNVRSDGVDHYGGCYADLGEAITAAMRLRDKLFTHHRRGSYD